MSLSGIPIQEEECIGDSLDIINNAFQVLDSRSIAPPGFISIFITNGVPSGYLECNGSRVLKSVYPDLFNAITDNGTQLNRFGQAETITTGDGDTSFVLPNFTNNSTLTNLFSGAVKVFIKY